jgi:hypothetical protein
MRVKLTAMTFGVCMGLVFLTTFLDSADDDGITVREWLAIVLTSAAAGILMSVLYVLVNRFLRRHGLSLHDDEDFED